MAGLSRLLPLDEEDRDCTVQLVLPPAEAEAEPPAKRTRSSATQVLKPAVH